MIKHPSIPYIAPFAVFLFFLAIRAYFPSEYFIRVLAVTALLILLSRGVISLKALRPLLSVLVGVAVFLIWIGPDFIWPAYRQHWLFHNNLIGAAQSSIPDAMRGNAWFLAIRVLGSILLVPVIEELFWRGWLMRYLISPRFETIRLGTYSAFSFWITAVLFASEHGSFWEVGLAAGIIYNWWMVRTHSLGDCIAAHAVTNACLAAYVIAAGQWQYWL